jgi:RHS repeat-associated protein
MSEGTTSMSYMRARYYDSGPARFLSRDTLSSADPRDIDPYQFVYENPMEFTDATGMGPGFPTDPEGHGPPPGDPPVTIVQGSPYQKPPVYADPGHLPHGPSAGPPTGDSPWGSDELTWGGQRPAAVVPTGISPNAGPATGFLIGLIHDLRGRAATGSGPPSSENTNCNSSLTGQDVFDVKVPAAMGITLDAGQCGGVAVGFLNPAIYKVAQDRETIGFEKTFLDGSSSIGVRVPFLRTTTLDGAFRFRSDQPVTTTPLSAAVTGAMSETEKRFQENRPPTKELNLLDAILFFTAGIE